MANFEVIGRVARCRMCPCVTEDSKGAMAAHIANCHMAPDGTLVDNIDDALKCVGPCNAPLLNFGPKGDLTPPTPTQVAAHVSSNKHQKKVEMMDRFFCHVHGNFYTREDNHFRNPQCLAGREAVSELYPGIKARSAIMTGRVEKIGEIGAGVMKQRGNKSMLEKGINTRGAAGRHRLCKFVLDNGGRVHEKEGKCAVQCGKLCVRCLTDIAGFASRDEFWTNAKGICAITRLKNATECSSEVRERIVCGAVRRPHGVAVKITFDVAILKKIIQGRQSDEADEDLDEDFVPPEAQVLPVVTPEEDMDDIRRDLRGTTTEAEEQEFLETFKAEMAKTKQAAANIKKSNKKATAQLLAAQHLE